MVSCLKAPPQTTLFFTLQQREFQGGPSLPLFICFQSEFLIAWSVQCWFGWFRHIIEELLEGTLETGGESSSLPQD